MTQVDLPALTAVTACPVCSSEGDLLYQAMHDRLGTLPGDWNYLRCRATDCGHLWMNPAIRADMLGWAYASYFTHDDSGPAVKVSLAGKVLREAGHWLAGLGPEWHRRKALFLPKGHGGRALDIGCGRGELLEELAARGWIVEGVEMDPVAARETSNRLGLKVHVGAIADVEPGGMYDAIVLQHVIEHLPQPKADLERLASWLAPGGTITLVTPNARSRLHARFGRSWRELDVPRHLHVFTPESLCHLGDQAGLEVSLATSAAVNHGIWLASTLIKQHGKATGGKLTPPLLLGCYFELVRGAAAHRRNPASGEELVAVLRRRD